MARIAGVDLPKNKRIEIALTYIYGIGRSLSQRILKENRIDPNRRVHELSEEDVAKLRSAIEGVYPVEGELRREVAANIRRLIEIKSYRGLRHQKGLPVRGQRTRHNARTRKGRRKTVGAKREKRQAMARTE